MTIQEMKVTIPGKTFNQFGKRILISQIPFATLKAIFEVDGEVQRKLDHNKKNEIRDFILQALEENDFYFSPFIFSSRGHIKEVADGGELSPGCKIYIIDGQHRSFAMEAAIEKLISQKHAAEQMRDSEQEQKLISQINKLNSYPVSIQIYLDLETKEERQMFTDLNTKRKEPHVGVIMQYDQRDEYAEMTRMIAERLEDKMEIEAKRSRITSSNSALTSLTVMRRCLLALFEGITTVKNGKAKLGNITKEEAINIATAFFETWLIIFPKNPANRKKYTSGYTGIQIALAQTVHQLILHQKLSYEEALKRLLLLKKYCSWKHDDPIFDHIYDARKKVITSHSSTVAIQKTAIRFTGFLN